MPQVNIDAASQRGWLKMSDEFWYDEQDLAAEAGIETPALRQILQVFQNLNMVMLADDGYTLPNWEKRQRLQSMRTERAAPSPAAGRWLGGSNS